jgi:hypothetical protein
MDFCPNFLKDYTPDFVKQVWANSSKSITTWLDNCPDKSFVRLPNKLLQFLRGS